MSQRDSDPSSGVPATEENVSDLLEALRERVRERISQGTYPKELEERLEQHFQRIAVHRQDRRYDRARSAIEELRKAKDALVASQRTSRLNSRLDGLARRIDRRTTYELTDRVIELSLLTEAALEALMDIHNQSSAGRPDLENQIDALLDRQTRLEQSLAELKDVNSSRGTRRQPGQENA